jgi:hypothetical protein
MSSGMSAGSESESQKSAEAAVSVGVGIAVAVSVGVGVAVAAPVAVGVPVAVREGVDVVVTAAVAVAEFVGAPGWVGDVVLVRVAVVTGVVVADTLGVVVITVGVALAGDGDVAVAVGDVIGTRVANEVPVGTAVADCVSDRVTEGGGDAVVVGMTLPLRDGTAEGETAAVAVNRTVVPVGAAVSVGRGWNAVAVAGGDGQPSRALATALTISLIAIVPSPFASPGRHPPTSRVPSRTFTMIRMSPMVTWPVPRQSPTHAAREGVGDGVAGNNGAQIGSLAHPSRDSSLRVTVPLPSISHAAHGARCPAAALQQQSQKALLHARIGASNASSSIPANAGARSHAPRIDRRLTAPPWRRRAPPTARMRARPSLTPARVRAPRDLSSPSTACCRSRPARGRSA